MGSGEAYRKVWVKERGRNAVIIISEIILKVNHLPPDCLVMMVELTA